MIIYDIKGEKIQDVLITKSAVHEEELMKKNLVRLSWSDVEKRHYPVGTYIKPFADKGDDTPYFLFQPYDPEQVSEVEYKYSPEFQHPMMYLQYVPYVNKTKNYDEQDITKLDWSYVGGTAELLADICKAINAALKDANLLVDGEEFKSEVISTNNVAIKDTTSVTFASVDILSALNQIAQYNECEWHLSWDNKTLYFGDISIDDGEVILQVDENIGVASIRNDKEGFWNVFYPQGGTKNMIRQMSADEYIHSNERLMLDKTVYPDGVIYTDENGNVITAEEFAALGQKKIVKVLTFEDIYPKLTLYMYRLRERRRTRFKDDEQTDPYITGTDENGNPIYEKYADWYFRLAYPIKDENGNIIDWKDFDGLTARTPKALIQNVNENKVRLRVPFVTGKNFYTNSDGTVTATIDDVSVVATIGGMTGDAAQPDLTIEKTTPNYGKFMQKVIDGATDMALTAGIDTAVWCECAATRGELDEYTYTKSLIVNGEKIGAAFGVNPNSDAYQSRLAGREFELDYYDTNQTIEETEHDSGVVIEAGDYHIIREDGDIIIPTTSDGGIYPQADWDENVKNNTLSLFNIVMTDDYKKSAQNDLANATLQEIKYYHTDLRTYTVKSNPVEFAKKNPNLYIGRKVTYKDLKGYTLSTRVMALTTQLDFPIEQTIYIGNIVIKGTQQQLKEDVKAIVSGNGFNVSIGGGVNKSEVEKIIKQYSDTRFLSKTTDDTAQGEITFNKGAKFGSKKIDAQGNATLGDVNAEDVKTSGDVTIGSFTPGLTGSGAKIDRQGHGEMRSLRLWESLEVPEIRYNRISINIGFDFDSVGGGIIESVTPDYDENGNALNTGTCTLKLEDGEAGAIAKDDLCMGMWHDEGDLDGNATKDSDDRKGSFTRKGFKTVYFHITEVDKESSNNGTFKYTLRSEGGNGVHPYPQMHFAQRGNPTNKERQAFRYSTTEYTISLCNVDSWTFDSSNIYEIRGKLDGFTMLATNDKGEVYTKTFSGYGQVFGNAYMYGTIDQFDKFNVNLTIIQSLNGELAEGEEQTITIIVNDNLNVDENGNAINIAYEYTFVVTRSDGTQIAEINGDNPTFALSYSHLASEHEIFTIVGTHKNGTTTIDGVFVVDKLIPQEQYMGFWDSTITYMRTRRTFPTVTHLGSKWYLVVSSDKGTEPMPNSSVWKLMQGSEEMRISFSNSSNFVVLLNNVNTIVTLHVMLGSNDITEQILSQPTTILNWSRNSGDTADDYSWKPTIPDLTTGGVIANPTTLEKRNLWLRHNNDHNDLGLKWRTTRTCTFTAQIILPNGDTHEKGFEVNL